MVRSTLAALMTAVAVLGATGSASACSIASGTPTGAARLGTADYAFAGTITSVTPDTNGQGGTSFTMDVDRYLARGGPSTLTLHTAGGGMCGLNADQVGVGKRLALVHDGPLDGVVEVTLLDDLPESALTDKTPHDFRAATFTVTYAHTGRRTVQLRIGYGACETVRLDAVTATKRSVAIRLSTALVVPNGSVCPASLALRCIAVVLPTPLKDRKVIDASTQRAMALPRRATLSRSCTRVSPGAFVPGT